MIDLTGSMLKEYYLFRRIHLGEVADVYGAYASCLDGAEVAVKVFRPGYTRHAIARHYLLSEARKVRTFQHRNILPLLAYGEERGLLYTVTPFIITGTLEDLLYRVGGRFSMAQALPMLQQICSAVQYAHEHEVVHGNIKPANIFISQDGRMLLADFGIACGYDEKQQELTRVGWGAAAYAAPEQRLGVLRRSSDVYALGVLLFRLLTGSLPFVGQSPTEILHKHVHQAPLSLREFDPSLPLAVDAVIQRALRKPAEERFSSARELSAAFYQAVMTEHEAILPATREAHFEQESEQAFPGQGRVQALPVIRKQSSTLARQNSWHGQDYQEASLLYAADPTEWSPLMAALATLEPVVDVPDVPTPPVSSIDSRDETHLNETQEFASGSLIQRWLPLLVLLLLLLGLLGALFSAFYFPNG